MEIRVEGSVSRGSGLGIREWGFEQLLYMNSEAGSY